jgi:hypothetical protein
VELAVVTGTAPRDWWDEEPATILTAVDVLEEQARMARRGR